MRVIMSALLMLAPALGLADWESTKAKIEAAMAADIRGEADTERDRNRRPLETLEFFGFRDDMTVVELLPGGGWYTKILAPVVAENGQYYGALGTGRIESSLLGEPGFEKAEFVRLGQIHRNTFINAPTHLDASKTPIWAWRTWTWS